MKIKVLILFCFLFLGIGFEGFGQGTFEDMFPKVKIETDTAHVALYKKLKILRSCEYLGVSDSVWRVWHLYDKYLQEDSTWYYYAGFSLVEKIILLSTQNNGIVDMVLQPQTIDNGEGTHAGIWTLNNEGKYKRTKLFQGGSIQKIYKDKNNILKIDIESSGCCDNYFRCNEIYSYQKGIFLLEKQVCYLRMQEELADVIHFKKIGTLITQDSTFLFTCKDSVASHRMPTGLIEDYDKSVEDTIFYDYEEPYKQKANLFAFIKPNEKGDILRQEIKDNMYWYLVVFSPNAIQRRIYDNMIGQKKKQISLAGWIKSKTPLKIESK